MSIVFAIYKVKVNVSISGLGKLDHCIPKLEWQFQPFIEVASSVANCIVNNAELKKGKLG